ncbi:MAG: 16S rRNA (cytosine(967)-C(5))-methyltransferase RsmB [Clostridia bacterium]|nr:16S rRNA (cytosine(967)-C(5))-methyltransferase RsmB [Clostridia bacterium]
MSKQKQRSPDPARLAAAEVLYAVYEQGAFSNLSARSLLDQKTLDERDRRFAAALIYNTLQRTVTIDWLIEKVSHKPLESLDPWVRTVLRMGVWQLYWSHSVPAHAAIDESVRLVTLRTHQGAAGYVNAILRRLDREPIAIPADNGPLQTGLPPVLYQLLKTGYDPETAEQLARQSLFAGDTLTARVNKLKTTPDQLRLILESAGVSCQPGRYCEEALLLSTHGRIVSALPGFKEGLFSIQDEAAMLVGFVADPQSGWLMIDLCAAPGGKTTHLSERTGGQANIMAVDVNPKRLNLVSEQSERLGLSGITCIQADSRTGLNAEGQPVLSAWEGKADLVLADVPCSGLGLLARKPEIRLHMTAERIEAFIPLQSDLLDQAAALLKPGGRLVYSTCTLNPAENEGQRAAFLKRHGHRFFPEPFKDRLPKNLMDPERFPELCEQADHGFLQLLPHRHGTDGFFIASFIRRASQRSQNEALYL